MFRVRERARFLAFYRERLGFELEFLYEGFCGGVFRDGCHRHLQCGTPAERDQAVFERNEPHNACIVVRDAQALFRNLGANGVAFTVPLRQMPYGSEFCVREPDGHILGFVQPASEDRDA